MNKIIEEYSKQFEKVSEAIHESLMNVIVAFKNTSVHFLENFRKKVLRRFYPEKDFYIGVNGTIYLKQRKGLYTCSLIKLG